MVKTKNVVTVREEVKGTPAILISQAIAKGSDLDKLEKLLALQERFEANEARKAYHKAMTTFKANLPRIDRNKKIDYAAGAGRVKYSYATLFNAVDKIIPELSKYGLSMGWSQKQTEKELTVTCRITHELGHSEETSLTGPHDTTGSKNAIQALGSTNSYLERYTFFALLGVAAKDQDDDAQSSAPVECISDKELSQLVDCLTTLKKTEKSFCALMKIPTLDKMPKEKYDMAMKTIKLEAERTGIKL
jgi:hypothetical protein